MNPLVDLLRWKETEDLAARLRAMGPERLTAAILNIPISDLDWHVSQIVKGEDDAAGELADLILDALARTP